MHAKIGDRIIVSNCQELWMNPGQAAASSSVMGSADLLSSRSWS